MYIDSRSVERDSVIEADLCVVGAGPAGISIAKEFLPTKFSVALFEGGGTTYDQIVQSLYKGTESGELIHPESHYLTSSRMRFFGGTSNVWQGWCRPLDPEIFEPRSWIGPAAWPIDREEFLAYSERAEKLLEISPFDYSPRELDSPEGSFLFDEGADFETTFVHINRPTNFGEVYGDELKGASNIRVFLHGNMTQIHVNSEASKAEGLEVRCLDGNRFGVKAKVYVLAAGGIETARLLLASNQVQKEGLGNGHDLVGRTFMDHPTAAVGFLVAPNRSGSMRTYRRFRLPRRMGSLRAVLRLKPQAQERHRLLTSLTVLRPLQGGQAPPLLPDVTQLAYELRRIGAQQTVESPAKTYVGTFEIASEQAPNPDSRITLGEEIDPLGVPRIRLDWRLSEQDARSIRITAELLARELGKRLSGRVNLLIGDEPPWERTRWSNHHMGATRMDPNPRQGVVDTDCKVHSVAGLYIASSSVFPIAGCSNPTFSIVSLALRLSDHLKGVLQS